MQAGSDEPADLSGFLVGGDDDAQRCLPAAAASMRHIHRVHRHIFRLTCHADGTFFPDHGHLDLAGKLHLILNFLSDLE